ncbi:MULTISPECIES: RagB/SusD family nutrient uptake outer membrane protein [Prevotellaceae]|uniref:RagB/SusD family nutrient uptake outer membrane protein n=1 Tax=Prevotellaceae TaxID=171552 RepID=UPI000B88B351|nr:MULTISPECIES: RagB/SusD family nutrient uptake outer membrane protein [Prevotellaceae]QVJ82309.1 RagB/SusD family nutrient uptake outer membrane protein [Xylanibacter ruminicola]
MKNNIKLAILSMSLMGLASCDMDAPSISTLDESSVFATYSLAESEVMSIHVSFGETNSYRGRFLPYYGVNSDVEWGNAPSYADRVSDKQSLWNYSTQAANGQMNTANNAYAKFYEGIERANLAIKGIRQYGNIENNADMRHLLGEALTLRAVIYNDLLKAWGDVPARFEPNNSDNMYLPRTNRDVIYKQLLADLLEAEDYCYWAKENAITKTTERVNKDFVKALRARLALYAGGYGLRGDGYRLSKDPELAPEKMYQIAKQECEEVIAHGSSKLGSFKENFVKLCQDNVTAGGESLWEIPFSAGRGRVLYTWGLKHNAKDQYTQQSQGGINRAVSTLYYDYDPEDIRRDITVVPYEWSKDLKDGKAHVVLSGLNKMCFGKLRYEWMSRIVTSTNDDGVNWQYMRLADVYLMAAEAENELGNTAAAWSYMKPVLDRVLPAAKVSALQTKYTASQQAFREGIYDQRALEFAGEALRKADLVRWGIIDQKMAEAKAKLQALQTRTGDYAGLPDKVYLKTVENESEIEIYGLNKGENDATVINGFEGDWESKSWFGSADKPSLTDDIIDGLYVATPSLNCLWPIWQNFIDSSNNMLNNDGNYGQLSD